MALALTRPPLWRFLLDGAILALALTFAALMAKDVLDAPFGGMRAPMYLVLASLLIVAGNRALALLVKLMPAGIARNLLRVAKWTLPFVLPYLAIPPLEAEVQARQLAIAQRELAPLVRYAQRHARDESTPQGKDLPVFTFPVPVHYRRDVDAALVWLTVPTIDIDGATLTYDARADAWQRRHKDEPGALPSFLGACELRAGEWKCDDGDPLN